MHQMRQSQEREERLINCIMDNNNNNKTVAAVMEGIQGFQQSMAPLGGHPGHGYEQQESYTTYDHM